VSDTGDGGMAIGIRDATDADLEAIAAILNVEIADSPYVYAETCVTPEDRRVWLNEHQAAGFPVLVATRHDDADVVGWAAWSPYRSSSGYRFTAEASVYVARAAHRRGVGARLVSRLLNLARGCELHVVVASIDAANVQSLRLFERFGFRECARLPEVGRKFGEWRTQVLLHRRVEG
jgi:L-amino acid N-acyltransferase